MSATFLDVIWPNRPDLFGEIRAILPTETDPATSGPIVDQWFLHLGDNRGSQGETIGKGLEERGFDVYFGVLPRLRNEGTAADVAPESDLLWADIDAKHFSNDLVEGKALAHAALANVHVLPQILVDSGGGLHAYWLLDRSIEFDYAHVLMRGIARVTGGDAVADRARVLRLPGTLNQKRLPLVPARILRFDLARSYKPGDFDDLVVVDQAPRVSSNVHLRTDELPDWLLELIKTGAPVGQRSEACFKVCVWLIRYGRTDEEIQMIFESTPDGIGNRYYSKKGGPKWLTYTLTAARKAA